MTTTIPLVCPHCYTVAIAPAVGEPVMCPCLDRPPYTKPVTMMRLRLPQGYEITQQSAPEPPA